MSTSCPVVSILAGPELSAVRDMSQAFTDWTLRIGTAFRAVGNARVARGFFLLASTRDPENANTHYELGLAHLLAGDATSAKASLLAGLDVEPFHGGIHYNLGTVLEEEGDFLGAETEYLAAIGNLDDPSAAHARLGALLAARGDLDAARDQLSELNARDPDGEAARFLRELLERQATP